jgi:hypothetical protein
MIVRNFLITAFLAVIAMIIQSQVYAQPGEMRCLQLIGDWSNKAAWTIAYDETRDLVFVGSCGCICILDVTNPSAPKLIHEFQHSLCNTCGLLYDEEIQLLYICSGVTGLRIWDLKDIANPIELGHYDTPGYACGVSVSNDCAFVADGDAGVRVIDVSEPGRPCEVGHFNTNSASCIEVHDGYAYVADVGLRIISISDPSNPQEIAYLETPGLVNAVFVANGYAYVADDWCGLRIVDISLPARPREIACYETPGHAWGIYVLSDLAYVSAYDAGLQIIDISDPKIPYAVAYYETPTDALDALVYESNIYIAGAADGLVICSNFAEGGNK